MDTRAKLKSLALNKTEKLLSYSRQLYYERENKAHTLLARQLRKEGERRTPHSLKDSRGNVVYDPNVISQIFYDYFSKLYSLPTNLPTDPFSHKDKICQFISSCGLPTLPPEALDSSNAPIDAEEIEEVLKTLPSGKARAQMA